MKFPFLGIEVSKIRPFVTPTPVTPTSEGATVVSSMGNFPTGGYYGYSYDFDGAIANEAETINYYREVATYPECDTAIEQIVGEMVITEQSKSPVSLNLDNLPKSYGKDTRAKITKSFEEVLALLNFSDECHNIVKRWYIDGRLYFYITADEKKKKSGITDIKYVDPRKIRKVVDVIKEKQSNGIELIKEVKEYYVFNDKGLDGAYDSIRLSNDSVIYVPSGLTDATTGAVLSHLHQAIKPVNQLKMMEDALVIYRISRAPERRIFYVDVGTMPPVKAKQHIQEVMQQFRNKIVYDADTGKVKNNRNFLSMMEDFWIPRRGDGKSTEIQTLPGAQGLSDIEDLLFFKNKVYQSLKVPRNRIQSDNNFSLGRATEITREEILFSKFVQRLRNNFNVLFKQALRVQLRLKNIVSETEWEEIKNLIQIEYQHDNYFEELKRGEIFQDRLNQLQTADAYKGEYFSKQWLAKNILQFNDDEWVEIQSQIKAEKAEGGDDVEEDDGYDSFGFESEQKPKPLQSPKDDSVDDAELEDEERYEDKE